MKTDSTSANPESRIPNPGSPEAVKLGCRCPVLDNAHGKGYMGIEALFVYSASCPIHNSDDPQDEIDITEKDKEP